MIETLERYRQAIQNREFTPQEIHGFSVKPELALVAGMAMGYQLAIDDIKSGKFEMTGAERG